MTNRQRIDRSLKALRAARWNEIPRLATFIALSTGMILLGIDSGRKRRFSLNGYRLALRTSGRSGFNFLLEVIVDESYRAFGPMLLGCRGGGVVIDCGANVGFFALWALRLNPELRIYAFEPHPSTHADLCEHLRLNHASDRVVAENAAVGGNTGSLDLELRTDTNMAFVGDVLDNANDARGTRVKVPVITLDEYCSAKRLEPKLLKIDVEGYESEVLAGAERTLASVSAVILEAHTPTLVTDCTNRLRQHGFRVSEANGLLLAVRD